MTEVSQQSEVEEQTSWNEQWSEEKLELMKRAIQESRLNCEADEEDLFERPEDK